MICNTLLGQFCFEHAENWEELLSNEPYNLKISRRGKYVCFKYNQLSSDFNEPIVREARGIIFREYKWDYPVCHGFNKFGNIGESYVPEIDWSTAKVTEKIDGSLIKLWYDNDWHISTNGQIYACDAEFSDCHYDNFSECFVCTLASIGYRYAELTSSLNKNCTYMFELVSPYNRIVIPYENEDIYYLGCRHNQSGEEYPFYSEYTSELIDLKTIKLPKVYDMNSLEDVKKSAEELPWDEEGYVVCDDKFNRCKIKSTKYVTAHFARNNNIIIDRHLIKVILQNEQAEFLLYASDYEKPLRAVESKMIQYENMLNCLKFICVECSKHMEKKQYAEVIKTMPSCLQTFLFKCYDNENYTFKQLTEKWDEYKWERILEQFTEQVLENEAV